MIKADFNFVDILKKLEVLFLALIFNMNALKIVTRINSNSFFYIFYLGFICISALRLILDKKNELKIDIHLLVVIVFFVFSATLSIIRTDYESGLDTLFKLISGLILAYLSSYMSKEDRIKSFKLTAAISTCYAVFLLMNYRSVYSYFILAHRSEYLMITLPLGIGLSLSLIFLLMHSKTRLSKIVNIVSCIIQFAALVRFPARANVLFPLLIIVGYVIIKNRKKPARLIISIAISAFVLFVAYNVVMSQGNNLLSSRIERLFTNIQKEPRVVLYNFYTTYILQNANYIFGQGFAKSAQILRGNFFEERYPHNLFLEIIGENGLIGILLIAVVAYKLYKGEKSLKEDYTESSKDSLVSLNYVLLNIGLLFFLLTYSKSYSIYNGYQLFIFLSMIIHEEKAIKRVL